MNSYSDQTLAVLQQTTLFAGIEKADLPALLGCLAAASRRYRRGEFPLLPGDPVPAAGVLLAGGAEVIKEDLAGNRTIVTELVPGDIFAEALACAGAAHSPVGVFTQSGCGVLWLDMQRILTVCGNACAFHTRLVQNLMRLLAQKNILLTGRIDVLSGRSIRARLLAFFQATAAQQRRVKFTLPMSRTALADYIAADRSAMTRELGRMQEEGLVRLSKNAVELL